MKGIIAKKVGMTRLFAEDGAVVSVTVLEATPNPVVATRTAEVDGYDGVQLAADEVAARKLTRAEVGHLSTAGVAPHRILHEIRGMTGVETGSTVDVGQFEEGETVKVTGTSIGKGFQGTIKRHNFSRGPMSHGSHNKRAPGSIGASATPSRVMKGKKMPGQMGNKTVTQRGLKVARVDGDRNLIMVRGSVPGPKNSYVVVVGE